jgi:hypothetical protein
MLRLRGGRRGNEDVTVPLALAMCFLLLSFVFFSLPTLTCIPAKYAI